MLVGKATRLARFLDKDEKEYEALFRFGIETDTGDCTGSLKSHVSSLKSLKISDIANVLPEFRGEITQTPPMYSAKKVEGKKLYELARKGIEIERKPVSVNISKLEITDKIFKKNENGLGHETCDLGLAVSCSAGTYIRTLAEDIGQKVGVGAHLAGLRRIRAGKFALEQAVTIEALEEIVESCNVDNVSISMNEAVSHLPNVILSISEAEKTKNGMKYEYQNETLADEQPVRMIDQNGELAAIGFYKSAEKHVQPKVVLL